MNAFVDNTSIHRIFTMIRPQSRAKPIRKIDALALLQFAEHLLFSEGMTVSTFEWPQTCDITNRAIEVLTSAGCVNAGMGISLRPVDFTDAEYAEACKAAAPRIQEVLQTSKLSALKRASKLAGETTRPINIASPRLDMWLGENVGEKRREIMLASSLSKKAAGAFDFTICADPNLYMQLRVTATKIKEARQRHDIASFLEVMFRVAINEQLARIKQSSYSPAPQRAKVVHVAEQLSEQSFRNALARTIDDEIRGRGAQFASKLMEKLHELKTLPFPMFVLHYLREARPRPKTPLGLLETARNLREDSEVKEIRRWLNKWEIIYGAGNDNQREKAEKQLDSIANELKIDRMKAPLFSMWRPKMSSNPTGFDTDPDVSGGLLILGHLLRRVSFLDNHSIFLATLSKEFEFDRQIGVDLNGMLGRALVD
ncbi:MAG: hypothetical protein QOH01_991 [Verrucomicrobiota bacterium]|jgi:hypothetical protein